MKTKIKVSISVVVALLLIACGGGTAVPKNKPKDFKTPTPTVKANDKCSTKGATIKINGKTYTCTNSRRDPTLRWKR